MDASSARMVGVRDLRGVFSALRAEEAVRGAPARIRSAWEEDSAYRVAAESCANLPPSGAGALYLSLLPLSEIESCAAWRGF